MKFALSFTLVLVLVVAAFAQNASELSGYVRNRDNSPVSGAIVTIGNFNVATNEKGYYRMTSLRPGLKLVSVSPPNRQTREFRVMVNSTPTQRDFMVTW